MHPFGLSRLPKLVELDGMTRTARYAAIAEETFPRPIKIGSRAVAWPSHEVTEINKAEIAGFSKDQLRALVRKLEAERKTLAPNIAEAK